MLIIANVLELNGGTTFILRLAREFDERKVKVGVLVLIENVDQGLLTSISQYADVFYLKDFNLNRLNAAYSSPLGGFLSVDFTKLSVLVEKYGAHVHVMGVFGLLFVKRIVNNTSYSFRISVGVYHQNEFMFDGVECYFANKAKKLFSLLPAESIIFFNEKNRESYARFFSRNYSSSTLVPIGIDLPKPEIGVLGNPNSNRLISIGNLHVFKAYNRHVISLLPELKIIRPDLMYEIYGTGPYKKELVQLISSLGLESSVIFKGAIAYDHIPKTLQGGLAFIGSGTAIVEASALGLPSVIGIESSPNPVTYGFLSDIQGFSYNEAGANQPVYLIKDKLLSILQNGEVWNSASEACKAKAQQFSMKYTADGFSAVENEKMNLESFSHESYSNFIAGCTFLKCAIQYKLGLSDVFLSRRDQGTLA